MEGSEHGHPPKKIGILRCSINYQGSTQAKFLQKNDKITRILVLNVSLIDENHFEPIRFINDWFGGVGTWAPPKKT